jgi:hypothetical protein
LVTELRDIDQGALTRAWADLRRVSTHWWRFRIPAAVLTALFAVRGAFLSSDASAAERIGLTVGGTLGGALVLGGLAFLGLLLTAPVRQRNEMRKAIRDQGRPGDERHGLVRRYSTWVQATRANLPEFPRLQGPLLFFNRDAQEKRQADHAAAMLRYREATDEVERKARREYHDQFREPLLQLLGNQRVEIADNPRTIEDLEEIERMVVRCLAEAHQEAPPEEAVSRVLRRVAGLLINELSGDRGAIEAALKRETYWSHDAGLKTERWEEVGSDLAEHGLVDAHSAVSAAYAQINALNQDAVNTWSAMEAHYGYDPPPGRPPTIRGNEATFTETLDAIATAEAALTQV